MKVVQLLVALGVLIVFGVPAHAKPLVYCLEASPTTLSPALATALTDTISIADQLYDTLVVFEPGSGEIIPALAESWEISDDGRSYTFHLRKGVRFHTTPSFAPSREMTADDVIFSFERQWRDDHPYHDVSTAPFVGFDWLNLAEALEAIEKLDDHTVRFRLKQPDAVFLANLQAGGYFAVYSAEYAAALMTAGTPEKLDLEPVGTGPFQFVRYAKDSQLRYRAHPDYWAGKALVEDLVFAIVPDPSVRYHKLNAGECHILPYPNAADLASMEADPEIDVMQYMGHDFGFLALNMAHGPLADPRVRRAINLAIDKESIINAVYLGIIGRVAVTPVPPIFAEHNDRLKGYPHDLAAASRLLAEAGFADGFTVSLWATPVSRPYMPNGRRVAEMIQADLAKVGIDAEIVTYEWGEYIKRAVAGEHDMVLLGWIEDTGDPDGFLRSLWTCKQVDIGYNFSRWCNERFDQLIDQGKLVTDRDERADHYREAQALWHDDSPAVPIAHSVQFVPVRHEVTGFIPNPGHVYLHRVGLDE